MDTLIGKRLDKYQIISELGRGGMAVVFLAHDTEMERDVAIKVLPREFSYEHTFVERFQQEARAIARLNHPHILPVFDYGQDEGWTFIVMTYMPGGSLADRIRQLGSAFPLGETSEIVSQIAGALDYAHSRGIIHRDFKPANVLMGEHDNVALSDFGIAKMTEATAQLTGSGIIGTPAYMAPEMAGKGGISPLIDVYALGVTLYQMLTGELPFDADTPLGLLMAHANKPIPDPRVMRPDAPDGVEYVIERALSKDPMQRYQNARDLSTDLDAALAGTLIREEMTYDQAADASTVGVTRPDMPITGITHADQPAAAPLTAPGQKLARRGWNPVWVAGGLIGVAAIALGAMWATGMIPFGAAPSPTATQEAAPSPLPEVSETQSSAVSLNPTVSILFGTAQIQTAGAADYQTFTGSRSLQTGDKIRTGAQSAASMIFAEGVSLEVHAVTDIEVVRLAVEGSTLIVEINQSSGAVYHFIQPPSEVVTVQYLLHAPDGVVTHTGTQYWSVLTRAGWCFQPTLGSILFQLGQTDDDTGNDYPASADGGQSVLVRADRTISFCGAELANLLVYTDGMGGLVVDPDTLGNSGSTVTPTGLPTDVAATPGGVTAPPPVSCGDYTCDSPETTANCPHDCGTACGDGVCNGSETPGSSGCSADCGCGSCGAGGSQNYCSSSSTCYLPGRCAYGSGPCTWINKFDLCGQQCASYWDHCGCP